MIDSFIHRVSSSKWPSTMQAQRRATNKFMETTDAWSDPNRVSDFSSIVFSPNPISESHRLEYVSYKDTKTWFMEFIFLIEVSKWHIFLFSRREKFKSREFRKRKILRHSKITCSRRIRVYFKNMENPKPILDFETINIKPRD